MKIPKLTLHKFSFELLTESETSLPAFKGSMFRGAFGWALRNAVCVTRQKTCDNCLLRDNCSYFQTFETEIKEHSLDFLKGVKKTPHPFVIEPPDAKKRFYKQNESLTVNLLIFGDAIKYFPFFVYAFQKMGEKGIGYKRDKFKLISITNIIPDGKPLEVFDSKRNTLKTEYQEITEEDILKEKPLSANKITLQFVTPLRLQNKGKVIRNRNQITPEMLIAAEERRTQIVSLLLCENPPFEITKKPADIKITKNNLNYVNVYRYSNRQKSKMEMGGFLGEITLEGSLEETLPLLYLAEELHLGKNTVFGLGKYNVIYE